MNYVVKKESGLLKVMLGVFKQPLRGTNVSTF